MNILGQDLQRLAAHTAREARPRLAADPYRQRFHLMPPVGWMNDPNGLCFDGTFYHVFYQYGPFDPTGGVKFWGHYRSRDLLRWDSLPPMLCPDEPWNVHGVYSGSALAEDGRLYLYYTGNVLHGGAHDYTHSGREHNTALAVSSDGVTVDSNECLMHNCDYPRGLTCHVRDPKVWAQNGRYYMVQGARTSDDRGEVLVFESADKRHWTHIHTITTPEKFGYMWECPDLFELDGQWFLALSPQGVTKQGNHYQNVYSCGYFPLYGDFRGDCTLGAFRELDFGFDFYAPQSFSDGRRRLQLGWLGLGDIPYRNPTVSNGWQHCLTVPCELVRDGDTLRRIPAPELTALRGERIPPDRAQVFDLESVTRSSGRLVIRGSAVIEWEPGLLTLTFEHGGAGRDTRRADIGQVRSLRVLADSSSLELFVNGGEAVLTARYYPEPQSRGIEFSGMEPEIWTINEMEIDYEPI